MPGVPSLDQRAKGFKEVVTAKYKALDITAEKVADGKPATVLGIMNDLIANTGDLRGVFVSSRELCIKGAGLIHWCGSRR
jgi:ribose transport system substrate-binding protein